MKTLRSLFLIVFVAAACTAAGADSAKMFQLNQVPAEARKTIETQLAGAKMTDIARDEDDGSFTVSYKSKSGEERDFTVGEDGTLMSVEVALDETPIPVQRAIRAQIGTGTVENVEKSFEDNEISYDVDMNGKDGVERSFSISLDGKLQAMQMFPEELPAAVRKTIESSLGTAKLEDIFHITEEGDNSYYVEVRRDGKLRDFSVAENGKLQSVQIFLLETPSEVQATIKEKVGSGKVVRVDKSFEPRRGVLPYEIESRVNDKPFNFSVGPRGRFLGMDD
jgi:hypothetical protein